jgi:type I restriction enzyme, S subunit
MQKIFSQELRFKANDGSEFPEWEEKTLGEIATFLIKHNEKSSYHNQYPVLTSSRQGLFLQKDYYDGNDVASKDTTGYNVVPRGYFTYRHMSDDLIFKFNVNNIVDKGIVSTLYPVFTTTNINDEFLQLKLNEGNEFKEHALMQKQGGSRTYMYFNKLQILRLNLPHIDEQTKIASFLSAIDTKIDFVAKQLDVAKNFKKGLLQQMFV